jgi:CRISPR-associated endonuclease Cas1
VDHGTLLVRNGLTHFPQKSKEIRFFPGDANLPDRVVVIDGSGGVTFDALNWIAEQSIEFVRLNWQGKVTSIGNSPGYSANPKLVDAQRAICGTKRQIEIARSLIAAKLENSISTLQNSIPKSENREKIISKLEGRILEIRNPRNSFSVPKLLGIEGPSARDYFGAWRGLPLNWKGLRGRPIPEDWKEFSTRKMGWRKRSRVARHPINAMLNWGYGILANQIRSEVISAGLDPSIGILHGNSENPFPLVYDLMEPSRPEVDRAILDFATSHEFRPGDFTISKWGGCRLNQQMAKALAKQLLRLKRHGNTAHKFIIRLGAV